MEDHRHGRVRSNWKTLKGIEPTFLFVDIDAKSLEGGSAVAKNEEETES